MGAYTSLATTGLNLLSAQQAQTQAEKQLRNEEKRRAKDIAANSAEEERRQRSALLERLASERARAGAAGVATTGGSIDAILRGLESESRAQSTFRNSDVNRQLDALREGSEAQRRRNLLQLSNRYASAGISTFGTILGGSPKR